jgi:hypothetical protein
LKVVDINKGRNKLTQELDKFKESHKLDDFLCAVEYYLKNNVDDCSELEAEWEAQQQNISFENGMECFSKLLAKIKIEYLPIETTVVETADENTQHLGFNLRETLEGFTRVEEERKLYSDKYAWFEPAFIARQLLPEIYPADIDPGLIVGKYLHQLFPDKSPLSEDTEAFCMPAKEYSLSFTSLFYSFFNKIGCSIITKIFTDEHVRQLLFYCFKDIIDPKNHEKRTQSFSSQDVLQQVMFTTKEFFYTWYDNWLDRQYEYPDGIDEEALFSNSLSALKMLSFGKGNISIVGELAKSNSNLSEDEKKSISKLLAIVASEKYVSFDDLFSWINFNYVDAYYDDADYNETVIHHLDRFTNYRRKYLAGMFPADSYMCARVASNIADFIGAERTDFLILLTDAHFEASILCMQADDDQTHQQRCDCFYKSQERYICLFNKSIEEGLPEFAVALLSFYMFFRVLIAKGRFGSLQNLIPSIERGLSLPGAKVLKHTLSFVVDSVDKYFNDDPVAACSANYFRPYIPKSAELHSIEGGSKGFFDRKQSEGSVREFFEGEFGRERWAKLSENSRNCLISAELQWRNSAVEFGFGIKDWSGLITTYCKAIEGELVDRLNDFFVSVEYNVYLADKGLKRPAKPTAGWLLKELKSYDNMPQELQDILNNSKIRLAGENDLVNRLYDIVQNYRNISAHHDAVSMKRFAEFKEKLFQSGLLSKFIDSFA